MAVPPPPGKTQMFLLERLYFADIDCFDRDSALLHLTFVAFCLLPVIRKQYLKQCNYSVDQSAFKRACTLLKHSRHAAPLWVITVP